MKINVLFVSPLPADEAHVAAAIRNDQPGLQYAALRVAERQNRARRMPKSRKDP